MDKNKSTEQYSSNFFKSKSSYLKSIHPKIRVSREYLGGHISHFASQNKKSYLLVYGDFGEKSNNCLIDICLSYQEKNNFSIILPYFFTSTSNSKDISSILGNICENLEKYNLEGKVKSSLYSKPTDLFMDLLVEVGRAYKILLIFDGIHQLKFLQDFREFFWLPDTLPKNVKCIFTAETYGKMEKHCQRFHLNVLELFPVEEDCITNCR